ncbi:hypothetical protein LCGC14_1359900 [marine sediment metagenome]|uniref:Swt1-like HEPN domain-containing protein n=1 Tax=marine sediment metagenome TaxID=412755 RepID=A0A0F9KUH2_9ZZZZ
MKEQLIRIKFAGLIREIEEFINRIGGISLEKYGINDRELNDIKNLPIIIEIAKEVIAINNGYTSNWNTYGYYHHNHNKTIIEYLDFLKPITEKILIGSDKESVEDLINRIKTSDKLILEGINPKKYEKILNNIEIVITCFKYIYFTENILREFIKKILKEKGISQVRDIHDKELTRHIETRISNENKRKYLPIRGDHDIYYLDLIDLNRFFTKYWEYFKNKFESQNWITQRIKDLYEIRKRVAHNSSNLSTDEIISVVADCKEIVKQVDIFI